MISNATTNSSDLGLPKCTASSDKWIYLVFIPLPLVAGLVNVVVWIAATFNRKKLLRQSYIYLCVTSTLISNIMFLSLHLWEEIAVYLMEDEIASMPPGSMMKLLWTLCTSAWIAMLSAVCGNLAVLVFVMLDSTSFMKSLQQQGTKDAKKFEFQRKRRRAVLLLIFVWLLPFCLTLSATFAWNCVDSCHCSPNAKGEVCPRSMGCSKVWPPMKNSYMGMNVGVWFVEVIVLAYVTITGIRNYTKFNRQVPSNSVASYGNFNSLPRAKNECATKTPACSQDKEITNGVPKDQQESKKKRTRILFNPRLRLVSLLSSVFVASTIMIPIVFFIDLTVDSFPIFELRLTTMVLVQIYTLVFPLVLLRYLTNLKSAVLSLMSAVLSCCQ